MPGVPVDTARLAKRFEALADACARVISTRWLQAAAAAALLIVAATFVSLDAPPLHATANLPAGDALRAGLEQRTSIRFFLQAEAARDGVACEAAADDEASLGRSLRIERARGTDCRPAPIDASPHPRGYDYSGHPLRAPPADSQEVFQRIRTAA